MTSAAQFHYWFLCGLFVSYQSIFFSRPVFPFKQLARPQIFAL